MSNVIVPLSLNGIFDRTFHFIGKTLFRNLVIAFIFIVPGAILLTAGLQYLFGAIGDLVRTALDVQDFSFSMLEPISGAILIFLLSVLVFSFFEICAYVSVIFLIASEVSGTPVAWADALKMSMSARTLKVIGLFVLQTLAFGAILLIPYSIIFIAAVSQNEAFVLVAIPFFFAGIAAVLYLAVTWLFAQTSIVWEDVGVIESFARSAALVKNHWWRTLGIYLLLSLITGLAISILVTPVSFVALWDFFAEYFKFIQSVAGHARPTSDEIISLLSHIGWGYGIVIAANTILQIVFTPVYLVVMYFDLRARHGEFDDAPRSMDPQHIRPLAS